MAGNIVHVHLGDEDLGLFDFEKVTVFDAIQIKAQSGLTTKAFIDGLAEMDGSAMQALVWLQRRRKGAVVDLKSINFEIGQLRLEEETVTGPDGQQVPADPTTPSSGDAAAATSVSSSTSSI